MDNDKYLSKVDCDRAKGWQFRFTVPGWKEHRFFSITKYDSWDGAKKAAIKYRDEFLETAEELHITMGAPAIHASTRLPKNNTSGILGVNRSTSRLSSGTLFQYWQTTYITPKGETKTKSYAIKKYGELQALSGTIEARKKGMIDLYKAEKNALAKIELENLINKYDEIIEYLNSLTEDDETFLFLSMINNPDIENTSKQEIIDARVGQKRFRKLILDRWGHRCAVTEATLFIVASHIKPWKVSDDNERLDINNGIALSPQYDKAFDAGYISFENDGSIKISSKLGEDARRLGIHKNAKITSFNFLGEKYLEYHRRNIFTE